jgi:hypothetical protein
MARGAIAKKLADRLGWKLWDRSLTCEIARLAKVVIRVVMNAIARREGAERLAWL